MQLIGFFNSLIWKNEKNGHTIFRLITEEGKIECEGKIPKMEYYTPLILTGKYIKRENNGIKKTRFIFSSYDIYQDKNDSYRILSCGAYKRLTEKEKEHIKQYFPYGIISTVEHFQTEENPIKTFLKDVPKKDKENAAYVFEKTEKILHEKELFKEIVSCGGTYTNVLKVYHKYYKKSLDVLRENPYKIGLYAGISFQVCELLAKKYQIKDLSKKRADGFFFYAMTMIRENGNCFATKKDLKNAYDFLSKNSYFKTIPPFEYVLSRAIRHNSIYVDFEESDEPRIYFKKIYDTEKLVAENIKRLQNSSKQLNFSKENAFKIEKDSKITLVEKQRDTFQMLKTTGVKIMKGGPGTGKTTVTNLLIKYCQTYFKDMPICLCAPTGCAAQHLSEKTGLPATTIHYLIGAKPGENIIDKRKLPYKIYFVDEFSMADLNLTQMLLNVIPNGSLIILIGDADQLPSVDYGNVLQDLINSGKIDVYQLTDVFRQKSGSNIIENAKRVREKQKKLIEGEDFFVIEMDNQKNLCDMALDYLETTKGEWQILCPTKKYEAGSRNLTRLIQNKKEGLMKQYGDNRFFIGDKVMAIKNNYENNFFNGECGIIIDIDEDGVAVQFHDKEIYFDNMLLEFLVPADAITIHKSQGNEYSNVLIIIPNAATCMLTVNLLYTAITRAKESVVILSENDTLTQMLKHPKMEYRNTGLTEKMEYVGL